MKKYLTTVQSFHLNGQTQGFDPQTEKNHHVQQEKAKRLNIYYVRWPKHSKDE